MRNKKEIEEKLIELKKLYSKYFCDNSKSEDCKSILTQMQLLDWVLKKKYYTIEE